MIVDLKPPRTNRGMGEILGSPGPDAPQRLSELGARYDTTFVMQWVPDLIVRYGLRLMGT
jgi:hypothetical protein